MSWRTIISQAAAIGRSSYLLDVILRNNPIYYSGVRDQLEKFEYQGEDERKLHCDALLERTLRWSAGSSASGRVLADWPILEKSKLRDYPGRYQHSNFLVIPASTGGSTGVPIRVVRSLLNVAAEQAFIDHNLLVTGKNFRTARIAILRDDNFKPPSDQNPPFGKVVYGGRRLILSPQHLNPETIAWYVGALSDFAPDILWIRPSIGEYFAKTLIEKGLFLKIPTILSSSEVLGNAARVFIRQCFASRIIDFYGQAERVSFAYSQSEDEYFFHPAYGHVEFLPHSEETNNGSATADINGTGYWNEAMPLVRYRTGDRVIYPAKYTKRDLALVSLGLKPVQGISGRDGDYVVSPRGEILATLGQLTRNVDHVLRMQIVQTDVNSLKLFVLSAPGFCDADKRRLLENARQKIPLDMLIDIEEIDQLISLPSGKVPFVIRRLSTKLD